MWTRIKTSNKSEADEYYAIFKLTGDGMKALRSIFPVAQANQRNIVLFSTSGIHGHYGTIEAAEQQLQLITPKPDLEEEEEEEEEEPSVTFCVIKPRIVCMQYGNAYPRSADDITFLKELRASSHRALAAIGY